MKESSRFNLSGAKFSVASKNVKASDATKPGIRVHSIPNKFQLNRLAVAMLGVAIGSRVKFITLDDSEDLNEKFAIFVASDDDQSASKLNRANSSSKAKTDIDLGFSMSGIWSRIIQQDAKAIDLTLDALVKAGVAIEGVTETGNKKHRSINEFNFDLEPAGEVEIDGIETPVFMLTNMTVTPVNDEMLAEEAADVDFEEEEADDEQ